MHKKFYIFIINFQDLLEEQESQPLVILKLSKIIELVTSNPAKILKINKGNLSIGNEADFCIVDLYKPWVVKKEKMHSKSKNTCIEDKKLQGLVTNTFVKGEELFKI